MTIVSQASTAFNRYISAECCAGLFFTNSKEELIMIEIRNLKNKLICAIDPYEKTVEIVAKGVRTTISFLPNGDVMVTNIKEEN